MILPFALPLYTTRVGYKRVVEIREMFTQTVRAWPAVDAKDPYTAGTRARPVIAMELGRGAAAAQRELEELEWGGLLHDIGKIGVRTRSC